MNPKKTTKKMNPLLKFIGSCFVNVELSECRKHTQLEQVSKILNGLQVDRLEISADKLTEEMMWVEMH